MVHRFKVFFSCFLTVFMIVNIVCIEKTSAQEMDAPFSVEAILPDTQIEGASGYYHLQVNPGDEQTIHARIQNKRDHDITVHVLPLNSYTAPAGGIFYEESIESENTKLLGNATLMSELLNVDPFVELSANETVEVPIHILVPDTDEGTYLGGLLFASVGEDVLEEIENQEDEEGDIGFIIRNEITFTLAVQLDLPETPDPNFAMGDVGINIHPSGPEMYMEFINDAQMILRGTHGHYNVENENGEELFEGDFEPFTMVPQSEIRFPVPWQHESLEPGVYNVSISANVLDEEVTAERTFEIEGEQVREYEEIREDVPLEQSKTIPVWVWVIGGVVVAGIFYWLGARRK
ncbi:DUF916 domain-containing protein [Evansella sp. AB-P1]|uniref:DUF916 domain-containing protein n=1 Tax=Evansella sp. AB-P1 TaxID=3037653 RepID=UPI00241C00F2|nr:DUF916 domain-containing protein [Evansella sp. AB-P1]MDG5789622.1 DUF916 domain-containing protein [Evansella sp. AB-P1]